MVAKIPILGSKNFAKPKNEDIVNSVRLSVPFLDLHTFRVRAHRAGSAHFEDKMWSSNDSIVGDTIQEDYEEEEPHRSRSADCHRTGGRSQTDQWTTHPAYHDDTPPSESEGSDSPRSKADTRFSENMNQGLAFVSNASIANLRAKDPAHLTGQDKAVLSMAYSEWSRANPEGGSCAQPSWG